MEKDVRGKLSLLRAPSGSNRSDLRCTANGRARFLISDEGQGSKNDHIHLLIPSMRTHICAVAMFSLGCVASLPTPQPFWGRQSVDAKAPCHAARTEASSGAAGDCLVGCPVTRRERPKSVAVGDVRA